MTKRQRVTAALRHKQPDLCPWSLSFTRGAQEKMVAYTGDPDFVAKIGNHVGGFSPRLPHVEVEPGIWADEWGARWDRTVDADIGTLVGHVFPEPRLGDWTPPDPHDPRRWATVAADLAAQGDQFLVMSVGFSLFERAWTLRGMENLFMDMVENPGFVDDLFDALCERNIAMVQEARRFDLDGVQFGDDWGQQQGMLMGPRLWRRFIRPRLERMYAAVHDAGRFVLIHSCGNITEVLPDLIEIGLDCFNPFQPEVMDVYAVKRGFGDRLSFFGGVSTQRLLPYGTPAQVKAEAHRLMTEIGRGGGYILAPAHAIPRDAPPENLVALIEAVNEQ
ncbi:MAG TPA: uroporphyrinogen decarboxylase family protein [Armatimonadota bacterium]|jgi:uroporphyrinogen decarboxylase